MNRTFAFNFVFDDSFKYRFPRHLLYWLVILFYFSGFLAPGIQFYDLFKVNLLFLPLDIITTYLLIYLVVPKALHEKRNVIHLILLFLIIITIHLYVAYLIEKALEVEIGQVSTTLLIWMLQSTKVLAMIFFSMLFIKVVKHLYLVEINYRDLERKNIENKMVILTSQLHPHFLFNTLNNLYTLSKENSERTSEIIMKLSEVMRYILDDCNRLTVSLNKEIEIIKSYIDIQRLRYDESLKIVNDIDIAEKTLENIQIPPLLVFTFIENAFKHGVSGSVDNPWMKVVIKQEKMFLKIYIENSLDENYNIKNREGVGLKNVQKRLELYYPKQYRYVANKLPDRYKVFLEIKI